jgi:hypothetical protein
MMARHGGREEFAIPWMLLGGKDGRTVDLRKKGQKTTFNALQVQVPGG